MKKLILFFLFTILISSNVYAGNGILVFVTLDDSVGAHDTIACTRFYNEAIEPALRYWYNGLVDTMVCDTAITLTVDTLCAYQTLCISSFMIHGGFIDSANQDIIFEAVDDSGVGLVNFESFLWLNGNTLIDSLIPVVYQPDSIVANGHPLGLNLICPGYPKTGLHYRRMIRRNYDNFLNNRMAFENDDSALILMHKPGASPKNDLNLVLYDGYNTGGFTSVLDWDTLWTLDSALTQPLIGAGTSPSGNGNIVHYFTPPYWLKGVTSYSDTTTEDSLDHWRGHRGNLDDQFIESFQYASKYGLPGKVIYSAVEYQLHDMPMLNSTGFDWQPSEGWWLDKLKEHGVWPVTVQLILGHAAQSADSAAKWNDYIEKGLFYSPHAIWYKDYNPGSSPYDTVFLWTLCWGDKDLKHKPLDSTNFQDTSIFYLKSSYANLGAYDNFVKKNTIKYGHGHGHFWGVGRSGDNYPVYNFIHNNYLAIENNVQFQENHNYDSTSGHFQYQHNPRPFGNNIEWQTFDSSSIFTGVGYTTIFKDDYFDTVGGTSTGIKCIQFGTYVDRMFMPAGYVTFFGGNWLDSLEYYYKWQTSFGIEGGRIPAYVTHEFDLLAGASHSALGDSSLGYDSLMARIGTYSRNKGIKFVSMVEGCELNINTSAYSFKKGTLEKNGDYYSVTLTGTTSGRAIMYVTHKPATSGTIWQDYIEIPEFSGEYPIKWMWRGDSAVVLEQQIPKTDEFLRKFKTTGQSCIAVVVDSTDAANYDSTSQVFRYLTHGHYSFDTLYLSNFLGLYYDNRTSFYNALKPYQAVIIPQEKIGIYGDTSSYHGLQPFMMQALYDYIYGGGKVLQMDPHLAAAGGINAWTEDSVLYDDKIWGFTAGAPSTEDNLIIYKTTDAIKYSIGEGSAFGIDVSAVARTEPTYYPVTAIARPTEVDTFVMVNLATDRPAIVGTHYGKGYVTQWLMTHRWMYAHYSTDGSGADTTGFGATWPVASRGPASGADFIFYAPLDYMLSLDKVTATMEYPRIMDAQITQIDANFTAMVSPLLKIGLPVTLRVFPDAIDSSENAELRILSNTNMMVAYPYAPAGDSTYFLDQAGREELTQAEWDSNVVDFMYMMDSTDGVLYNVNVPKQIAFHTNATSSPYNGGLDWGYGTDSCIVDSIVSWNIKVTPDISKPIDTILAGRAGRPYYRRDFRTEWVVDTSGFDYFTDKLWSSRHRAYGWTSTASYIKKGQDAGGADTVGNIKTAIGTYLVSQKGDKLWAGMKANESHITNLGAAAYDSVLDYLDYLGDSLGYIKVPDQYRLLYSAYTTDSVRMINYMAEDNEVRFTLVELCDGAMNFPLAYTVRKIVNDEMKTESVLLPTGWSNYLNCRSVYDPDKDRWYHSPGDKFESGDLDWSDFDTTGWF